MNKLTVITTVNENWEYRCHSCKQLRFYPGKEQPAKCGACGKKDLTIGRPGTLPTKEN